MVTLALKRGDKHIILKFPKNEYDDMGLEFETFLMDKKALTDAGFKVCE